VDKELACYDRALRINPQNAAVWFIKGSVLAAQKRFGEAMPCLEMAEHLGHPRAKSIIEKVQGLPAIADEINWFLDSNLHINMVF